MHFFDTINFGNIDYAQLTLVVWVLVGLALLFDFLNGMNDAANSIATVVSTRVMSPGMAVFWAAFFNFAAFLIFELKVADTIARIIHQTYIDNQVIAGTLIGAGLWTFLCTYLGLPISVSHSLLGGMMGAAMIKGGFAALSWGLIGVTALFIVLSPLVGFLIGLLIAVAVSWTFRTFSPRGVDGFFRKGQLLSAAFFSLGHGGSDAQKTMGIVYALLLAGGALGQSSSGGRPLYPTEVVLSCHVAIALGTLVGGWGVIKTLGHRVLKLRPVDGFCAETGGAITLVMTIWGGIPVSTTHTITGSIIGVGTARYRLSAVRWGVAGRVVWAWVFTIPGAALMAALYVLIAMGLG